MLLVGLKIVHRMLELTFCSLAFQKLPGAGGLGLVPSLLTLLRSILLGRLHFCFVFDRCWLVLTVCIEKVSANTHPELPLGRLTPSH